MSPQFDSRRHASGSKESIPPSDASLWRSGKFELLKTVEGWEYWKRGPDLGPLTSCVVITPEGEIVLRRRFDPVAGGDVIELPSSLDESPYGAQSIGTCVIGPVSSGFSSEQSTLSVACAPIVVARESVPGLMKVPLSELPDRLVDWGRTAFVSYQIPVAIFGLQHGVNGLPKMDIDALKPMGKAAESFASDLINALATRAGEKELHRGRFIAMVRRETNVGSLDYAKRTKGRGAVIILMVEKKARGQKELVLIEQRRPPVRKTMLECPAGLIGDTAHSGDIQSTVAAESMEEVGIRAERVIPLFASSPLAPYASEPVMFVYAEGERKGTGGGVGSESITQYRIPLTPESLMQFVAHRTAQGSGVGAKFFAPFAYLFGEGGVR